MDTTDSDRVKIKNGNAIDCHSNSETILLNEKKFQ